MEGNLEEFNIVAILQTLAGGQMTGILAVWDAIHRSEIGFVQGLISHAESTLTADRLGEILVRTRRLTRPQLDAVLMAQQRRYPGTPLGQILVDLHTVSPDDLAMAVQIQILETMSQLLLWRRGRWHFQFAPPDAGGQIPPGAMTVEEVLSSQVILLDNIDESLLPGAPEPPAGQDAGQAGPAEGVVPGAPAAAAPAVALASHPADTLVVGRDALERVHGVLITLLRRTEGNEVCLIDSSGSLIARQGRPVHSNYPALFALAASIFASWQELGRTLGENKASTLLYQGSSLNICLSPVGSHAILMTLYQQTANGGLINFWSREASLRIGRLLADTWGTLGQAPAPPADGPAGRSAPAAAPPARNGNTSPADDLNADFQAEIARQMDDLFRG